MRDMRIGGAHLRGFFDLEGFSFEGFGGDGESRAGVGGWTFNEETLDWPKKSGQLGGIADGQEGAKNTRIVVAEKNGALIGKLDRMKFTEMIAQRAKNRDTVEKDSPMQTPTFRQKPFGEFVLRFEA